MRSWLMVLMAILVVSAAGCRRGEQPVAASGEAIDWMTDYEQAVEKAKEEGMPLMIDVSAPWCAPCKRLDETVFSRGDVVAASRQFVAVRVNGDERSDLVGKLDVSGYPTVVFLDPDGKELARARGAVPYQMMLEAMKKAAS